MTTYTADTWPTEEMMQLLHGTMRSNRTISFLDHKLHMY